MALVGPLSDAIGIDPTLWLTVGVFLVSTAIIASLPSVWAIRAPAADLVDPPTMAAS